MSVLESKNLILDRNLLNEKTNRKRTPLKKGNSANQKCTRAILNRGNCKHIILKRKFWKGHFLIAILKRGSLKKDNSEKESLKRDNSEKEHLKLCNYGKQKSEKG